MEYNAGNIKKEKFYKETEKSAKDRDEAVGKQDYSALLCTRSARALTVPARTHNKTHMHYGTV